MGTPEGGHLRMVLPNARRSWSICDSSQPDGLGVFDALDETDYCLPAGGDMVCHTANPLRPVWRIGIEDPHHTTSLIAVVVPIRSGAVATSGRAHRGRHLVDPHTGQHPTGVASATVIADSLTWPISMPPRRMSKAVTPSAGSGLGQFAARSLSGPTVRRRGP